MANIKIEIAENGTKTLATAGKYCDRNIDIDVSVAGGGGGGDITVEPIVLTGSQTYSCSGAICAAYIELFGDTVSTFDITDALGMFNGTTLKRIPFDINFIGATNSTYGTSSLANMFTNAKLLEEVPVLNGAKITQGQNLFANCWNLRYIPEEKFHNFNFDSIATTGNFSGMFNSCYSLRKIPMTLINNCMKSQTTTSYVIYNNMCNNCVALDEIVDLPAHTPINGNAITSNMFSNSTVKNCIRLARFTFALENGAPKVVKWKGQTLDMSTCGYPNGTPNSLFTYNSGITEDKEVKDAATYQALKNDPDWYTTSALYSRYNHDSAVETINSLPDASDYLATAGGTNTIKFTGAAGSATDGGAINTLTEEEIAVATAKGWTVTFA